MLTRLFTTAATFAAFFHAGLAWAQASAPTIPFRSAGAAEAPGPQQWLLAVLGSVVLLASLVYGIRRFGNRLPQLVGQQRHAKVLERVSVAQGVQLVLLAYGDRRLLLSVSATGATCLRDDLASETQAPRVDGANA